MDEYQEWGEEEPLECDPELRIPDSWLKPAVIEPIGDEPIADIPEPISCTAPIADSCREPIADSKPIADSQPIADFFCDTTADSQSIADSCRDDPCANDARIRQPRPIHHTRPWIPFKGNPGLGFPLRDWYGV